MRYIFIFLCMGTILNAQDCSEHWEYYEWRVDLRRMTLQEHRIDVPIAKIQIDFLGAPVGLPYQYSRKLYSSMAEVTYFDGQKYALHQKAYAALIKMRQAAAQESIKLPINYSYRSIKEQQQIYKKLGAKVAERPGYSEHHLYTTVDFKWVNDHNSKFLWLLENAFAYGWVPTYFFRVDQRLKKEPWHWRYVGIDAADKFYCAWKKEIEACIYKIKRAE